jgi:restriction system protein
MLVAIPDYESCMVPLLKFLLDGEVHTMKELAQRMADHFSLTDDERQRMLPSGQQTYINNRVGWAKSYLKKAGLLENPSRGKVRITNEGRVVLTEAPAAINCDYLMKYPSFVEFWKQKRKPSAPEAEALPDDVPEMDRTPDEQIEAAIEYIEAALAKAGDQARVIEGIGEPAALPTPELETQRKRPNRLLEHADSAVGPKERRPRKVPSPAST